MNEQVLMLITGSSIGVLLLAITAASNQPDEPKTVTTNNGAYEEPRFSTGSSPGKAGHWIGGIPSKQKFKYSK